MNNRVAEWAKANREIQLELSTVINHSIDAPIIRTHQDDTHKPIGIRLAKMLLRYDDYPSSDLWRDIQSLSAEILR